MTCHQPHDSDADAVIKPAPDAHFCGVLVVVVVVVVVVVRYVRLSDFHFHDSLLKYQHQLINLRVAGVN